MEQINVELVNYWVEQINYLEKDYGNQALINWYIEKIENYLKENKEGVNNANH